MTNRVSKVSAKTKIILFALLLIVLPSCFLGYLGFRSIENRGLQLKDSYRGLARILRDQLEGELGRLEENFLREVSMDEWSGDVPSIQRRLASMVEKTPLISDAFLLDSEGNVIHSRLHLEASARGRSEGRIVELESGELISAGERCEFVERNLGKALGFYQTAWEDASSPGHRNYICLLIARCYFKQKQYARAADEYRHLLKAGRSDRSLDGTPFRIIGLSRLADIDAALGNHKQRGEALLILHEELISNYKGFNSYDFYLETAKEQLSEVSRLSGWSPQDGERRQNLEQEETRQEQRALFLERAKQILLPQVTSLSPWNPDTSEQSPADSLRSVIQDAEGKPQQIACSALSPPTGRAYPLYLAYCFDQEFALSQLVPEIEKNGGLSASIRVGIARSGESLVNSPGSPPQLAFLAADNLIRFFPWWSIVLYDEKGKTFDQIIGKQKVFSGTALLGIFCLILVGAVLTLRAAVHEAETARMKSEFVSSVSHELRTPLSLIRLFGETMEMDQIKDAAKRREFSRIITRESRRLGHLIENVLDFSRMESGRREFNFEQSDVVEVVAAALKTFQFFLEDKDFEFVTSLPEHPILMWIDRDAISRAVLNLLSNAEKFSAADKYIRVEMVQEDGEVWIAVEDRGVGIPESGLKSIFEKFHRGEGEARRVQGSGLGLTIVRHIVEGHRGRIDVESRLGKGSRFTIRLPLDILHPDSLPPSSAGNDRS